MSHPITLLPWYQNGTLSEVEREEVAEHLQDCAECRAELESLVNVRRQMRTALESDAAPSPSARRRVMQNIARAREPQPGRIGEALRSLFAMKWAPAAAMVLIALQSGALLWTLRHPAMQSQHPTTHPVDSIPQPTTRSVDAPTARLRVQFVPTATEADIRALLAEVRGAIVGGPSAEGEYIVEVLASNRARAIAKAELLRERTALVRAAVPEPVPP